MTQQLDIDVYRGDTFALGLEFRDDDAPIDLSGRTYLAQVRVSPDSDEKWSMTVDMSQAAIGVLTLHMAPAVTAVIATSGVWDLQETNGAVVITHVAGEVNFIKDVSR